MGVRNLIAGLVIFVVMSHNIQSFAAEPQSILPGFQVSGSGPEDTEKKLALDKALECVKNWQATVGDECLSEVQLKLKGDELLKKYNNDHSKVPKKEVKEVVVLRCQEILRCSNDTKCECNKPPLTSSTCHGINIPKKDLNKNCDDEIKTFNTAHSVTPSTPSSVSDPGQNFQYILLMPVIFVIINAN